METFNKFKVKLININDKINYNKELCKRYPFLTVKSDYSDKIIGYDFTWFDSILEGWRKAFGLELCEAIRNILIKNKTLYSYRIMDIKEKWARLVWCGEFETTELIDLLDSYAQLSLYVCSNCGKPADFLTLGWILPLCEGCVDTLMSGKGRYFNKEDREDFIRLCNKLNLNFLIRG